MTLSIKFSSLPGAYERHLKRKYQNPLFPASAQALLDAELEQARQKDQQDVHVFLESFESTVQETARLAESVESEILLDLKEKLERLYVQARSLAGDMTQYTSALLKLLDVVMQGIRRAASDDPTALKKLQEESMARQVYFDLLETPLIADLMRGDEVIQPEELIPSILSESEADIPRVLELFEPEYQQSILEGARQQVAHLTAADRQTCSVEARLRVIEQTI